MVRGILTGLTLLLFLAQAYVLAGLVCVWLVYAYAGFEIVIIGFLIDGYFGVYTGLPVYTIGAFILWSGALALRQLLIVYDYPYASPS